MGKWKKRCDLILVTWESFRKRVGSAISREINGLSYSVPDLTITAINYPIVLRSLMRLKWHRIYAG